MEAVRKYIDADSLMTVMRLPEQIFDTVIEMIIKYHGKCSMDWDNIETVESG